MMKQIVFFLLTTAAAASTLPGALAAPAAPATVNVYSPQQLAERAVKLRAQADQSATGSASEVLERYPGHFTMLGFRDRSGGAEFHKNYADIDVVLDGSCTLITGGTMVDAKDTGHGEMRAAKIEGGTEVVLHKGDIVHVPASTPHQMMIPPGGSITYFVIKAPAAPPATGE